MIKKKLRALKQRRASVETALQYLNEQLQGRPRAIRRLKVVEEKIGKERMTTERLYLVIKELKVDLDRLELAIASLEVYALGQRRGRGRPPKRFQELLRQRSKKKGGETK